MRSFIGNKNSAVLLATAVVLAGCATPDGTNVGPYPAKYKEIVREHLRKSLFDPYTARDFQIATPKIGQIHIEGKLGNENGWTVCYRGNAKNRLGAYTGMTESVILIRDDRVLGSISGKEYLGVAAICKDAVYETLPLS